MSIELKIREEQMEVFQPVADKIFVKRVAQKIREKHAEVSVRLPGSVSAVKQLPDSVLHELVGGGLLRARSHGMSDEHSLMAFVVLMFLTAPNFDAHPLARRILKAEGVEKNMLTDRLLEELTEQNWQAIRESYDPGAWALKS